MQKSLIFCPKDMDIDESYWKNLISLIEADGYKVYDEVKDCDIALVLNSFWVNPRAFNKKKIFFGLTDIIVNGSHDTIRKWRWGEYRKILLDYCDEFVDLSQMTIDQAKDKVISYMVGNNDN